MKKKIINMALSLVTMIGMFGLYVTYGATPAYAAWSACPNQQVVCGWNGFNATGTMWNVGALYSLNYCVPFFPSTGIDQWTSVWNRIPHPVNLYYNTDCTLPNAVTIQVNQKVNLVNLGFDNMNGSYKVIP